MAVNYIPTLQNPFAGSNLGNITQALKAPQQSGLSPLLSSSLTNLQNSISGAIPDSMLKGQGGGLGWNPNSQASFINPDSMFPYGFNASGAPTGTSTELNPLGD
jgi:hypothetical protein